MGRPRKFERAKQREQVARTLSDSRSTNYDAGYLDGSAQGFRWGYREGHADARAGKPDRFALKSPSKNDSAARSPRKASR